MFPLPSRIVLLLALSGISLGRTVEKTMANISRMIAKHHNTECMQIFRGDDPTEESWRRIRLTMKELTAIDSKMTTGIYSFGQYVRRKSRKTLKVSCYKPMKIMFDDEETKKGFSYLSKKIPVQGSVWILFINSPIPDFFQSANLPFDIEMIVAEVKSASEIDMYEVYRVRHDYPLNVKKYGLWRLNMGLSAASESVYRRRNNLEGVEVKTGSIENWPTSTYQYGEWDGYFPRVWRELARLINCTTVEIRAKDDVTGTEENGTWNGLVGMALRDEIDVIVSELTLDKPRTRVLDHFHPLLYTSYQIFLRCQGFNLEWGSVFKPFSIGIWVGMIIWLLSGALAMAICYYLSLLYGFEEDTEDVFSLVRSFFFMLQTICQQGHYVVPRSMACRILFFTSYVASAILIPSYSASLISSLTQQTPYRPFNSLDEMLQDGKYRLLVKGNTAEYNYFSRSNSELLKNVYERLIKTVPEDHEMVNTSQAVETICNVPRYALFGIDAVLKLRFSTVLKPKCCLITLTKPLAKIYITMGAKQGHPYYGLINYQLNRLIDAGITKKIEHEVITMDQEPVDAHTNEVGMEEVFLMFVMTSFFIGVSLSLLIVERATFKWFRDRRMAPYRKSTKFACHYQINFHSYRKG